MSEASGQRGGSHAVPCPTRCHPWMRAVNTGCQLFLAVDTESQLFIAVNTESQHLLPTPTGQEHTCEASGQPVGATLCLALIAAIPPEALAVPQSSDTGAPLGSDHQVPACFETALLHCLNSCHTCNIGPEALVVPHSSDTGAPLGSDQHAFCDGTASLFEKAVLPGASLQKRLLCCAAQILMHPSDQLTAALFKQQQHPRHHSRSARRAPQLRCWCNPGSDHQEQHFVPLKKVHDHEDVIA
eukprot:1160690-Pelagomonas_calceolata.AAC.18